MTNEELYGTHKSDPHAGNGNSDSDYLVNRDRELARRASGNYGPQYEEERRRYLREQEEDRRHAGN